MHTSTPIMFAKPMSQSAWSGWWNPHVTQQVYYNTWSKFRDSKPLTLYDAFEGPNFVDFDEGTVDISDTFFDGRPSYCPSPQRKELMTLPKDEEPTEIIESLKTCSISTVDNEDSTIIAEHTITDDYPMTVTTPEKSVCRRFLKDINKYFTTQVTPKKVSVSNSKIPEGIAINSATPKWKTYNCQTSVYDHSQSHATSSKLNDFERQHRESIPMDCSPLCLTAVQADIYNNKLSKDVVNHSKSHTSDGQMYACNHAESDKTSSSSDVSNCQLSQIAVQPLSFEQGEKKNRKIKEYRREYYKMLANKINNYTLKAKPAPKFTQKSSTNSVPNSCERKVIRVPRKIKSPRSNEPQRAKNKKPKNSASAPKSNSVMQSANVPPVLTKKAKSTVSASLQKSTANLASPDVEKQNSVDTNNIIESRSHQNKKIKSFQTVLPHRRLEIPRGRELLTAKRARDRQLFDERLKEKERQREEARKIEKAAKKVREQEELAKLRKATVFKARPVPQYKNVTPKLPKRPPTEPMFPIYTKRRRYS